MLTRILKDNGVLSLLLVVLAFLAFVGFRANLLLLESSYPSPLALHWAFSWMEPWPWAKFLLSSLLLIFSGFLSRAIGIRFKLLNSKGWLPVLVMVGIAMLFPQLLIRPDVLLAIVLGQVMVFLILSTYKQDKVLNTLFHMGMLSGLVALLYGQGAMLLAVVFFSIFILRPGAWREVVMPLAGAAMMLVFLLLVVLWQANPLLALQHTFQSAWVIPTVPQLPHVGHIIMLVMLGFSLPSILQEMASGAVLTRNGMLILVSQIATALVAALIFRIGWAETAAWSAFPIALLISAMIEKVKVWWWSDLLIIALLVATCIGYGP